MSFTVYDCCSTARRSYQRCAHFWDDIQASRAIKGLPRGSAPDPALRGPCRGLPPAFHLITHHTHVRAGHDIAMRTFIRSPGTASIGLYTRNQERGSQEDIVARRPGAQTDVMPIPHTNHSTTQLISHEHTLTINYYLRHHHRLAPRAALCIVVDYIASGRVD